MLWNNIFSNAKSGIIKLIENNEIDSAFNELEKHIKKSNILIIYNCLKADYYRFKIDIGCGIISYTDECTRASSITKRLLSLTNDVFPNENNSRIIVLSKPIIVTSILVLASLALAQKQSFFNNIIGVSSEKEAGVYVKKGNYCQKFSCKKVKTIGQLKEKIAEIKDYNVQDIILSKDNELFDTISIRRILFDGDTLILKLKLPYISYINKSIGSKAYKELIHSYADDNTIRKDSLFVNEKGKKDTIVELTSGNPLFPEIKETIPVLVRNGRAISNINNFKSDNSEFLNDIGFFEGISKQRTINWELVDKSLKDLEKDSLSVIRNHNITLSSRNKIDSLYQSFIENEKNGKKSDIAAINLALNLALITNDNRDFSKSKTIIVKKSNYTPLSDEDSYPLNDKNYRWKKKKGLIMCWQ